MKPFYPTGEKQHHIERERGRVCVCEREREIDSGRRTKRYILGDIDKERETETHTDLD